jgi:hypothetical protein
MIGFQFLFNQHQFTNGFKNTCGKCGSRDINTRGKTKNMQCYSITTKMFHREINEKQIIENINVETNLIMLDIFLHCQLYGG